MSNKIAHPVVKKLTATNIVRRLKEALMVKTGIKSGPEFTARP